MKEGKGSLIITIGIVFFILSLGMFMQFKVVDQTNIENIEAMRETELREQLANWKEKYEEINTQYNDTYEKLNEYIKKREANQETTEVLDEELEQAMILSGQVDVRGEGVIVTLRDNFEVSDGVVTASDLLTLVNELRIAGAEAISINDQRIVNMSDIFELDYSVIIVNNNDLNAKITAPYVVKAIGNQKYLESALVSKKVGYVDQHSDINVEVEVQRNMVIEKYKGNINLKYSNIEEE